MPEKILSGGKEAVNSFIHERLLPEISKPNCPPKVNLTLSFRDYLESRGYPGIRADECSEKWENNLVDRVMLEISRWENLGLPRPLNLTDYGKTCITWRHEKYAQVTGLDRLPEEFSSLHEWIGQQAEAAFLLVGACGLRLLGADPIFVTDASGDAGVDLIGRISNGPLRSIVFFVQAKTSRDPISRDSVLLEYGKFLASSRTKEFVGYRDALGVPNSEDGASFCYVFMSNAEFTPAARRVASDLGVLLRSRLQMAYWLAGRTSRAKLESFRVVCGTPIKASLTRNLARELML